MSTNPKENALVVLAIDFGTTYSGYAYSFLSEYKEDHTKIYSNTVWKSGEGLQTSKTPTVILFNKDKKFDSFGYAAETKYKTLQEDDKADGWRFFRLFKMSLYTDKVSTSDIFVKVNTYDLIHNTELVQSHCKLENESFIRTVMQCLFVTVIRWNTLMN